ncbi:MAG: CopG family transcriptional regulator [Clostridia bacterium]|nr:CopG family transcriptional regulator [Clostridia bacterium]MBQ4645512.1 CopG family transcriptional regulator [Clostridia bacterium]MBR2952879.1 CopG family transcriptional regulator [Clostridia bacterium]
MKPLKEQISITVDGDILEKARELAEMDDRSLSQFINIALKEYVKKLENKN